MDNIPRACSGTVWGENRAVDHATPTRPYSLKILNSISILRIRTTMQQHGQLETDAFQYSAMKRCSMCMQNQSVDQFHKNCGSSDGLRTNCKSCHAEYRLRKRRGDKDEGGEDGDTDKTENDGMTENDDKTENDGKTEDSLYFLIYDFDYECI